MGNEFKHWKGFADVIENKMNVFFDVDDFVSGIHKESLNKYDSIDSIPQFGATLLQVIQLPLDLKNTYVGIEKLNGADST